jgi:uncharacterized protein (TIRG00374 family)
LSISDKVKHIAGILLPFILAVIFLCIAFYGVELKDVCRELKGVSFFWVGALCFSSLLSHFLRALRWKIIIKSIKPDTSVFNLFGALMVGYGINNVIPRLGELSRAVVLGRWEGMSKSTLVGTVVVERVIDILAFGIALLISIYLWSADLTRHFPWLKSSLYMATAFMAVILLVLYLTIKLKEKFYNIITLLIGKFSPELAGRFARIFHTLIAGFGSLKSGKNYFLTILLTAAIMLNYALNSYIGFYTLGLQFMQPVTFTMAWVFMSITAIGTMIPTPGGTGSYHTFARSVLVLLFGFNERTAVAFGFLTHIVPYILCILAAIVLFFILNRRYNKKSGAKEKFFSVFAPKIEG